MPRLATLVLCLLALGCGPETVHRPIELFLGGLSGQAQRLMVLLFPGDTGPACGEVTLDSVRGLEAPLSAEWVRDGSEQRGLTLPETDEGRVTIVAYSEDASGEVIQLACTRIDYADIESPDVSLQLSARPR